ncbi:MAG: MBL fold metallo-hydrolase [Bacteroidota bacterium]
MKIKFCGAAEEVTGSCHLLTLDSGYKILLDCGLYQGKDEDMETFNQTWLFDPAELDCLILSHAHIDHSGRVPKLIKDGFRGVIHSTHATRSLCSIMLLDSAKIQQKEAEYTNKKLRRKGKKDQLVEALYTTDDVKDVMKLFSSYSYDTWIKISDEVELLFKDAGHILGSASVTLKIIENNETKMFGFTGDIGRPDRPILRDPQPMPPVDFLITESTYGDKLHEEKPQEVERFLNIIKETCIDRKGKLVIPAFSIGRTQEIVYILDQLETAKRLPHIPVYVDSPLAVNATMIFGAHPECYDDQLSEYMLVDDNPFGFNALTYVRSVEMSKHLNESDEPSIIISSSGMMNAGRIKHHTYHEIDNPLNTFLIVGYCAPHTPGGMLRAGKQALKVFGDYKAVKARIEIMDSFSAHGDQKEMIDFFSNQKESLKQLFLVHGEEDTQKVFKEVLQKKGFKNVEIPSLSQEYNL